MITNSKRNKLLALNSKKIKKDRKTKKEKKTKTNVNESLEDDIVKETRFNKVHFDPRFASLPKSSLKEKIDSRFATMFTDDRFKIVSKTDKYGREMGTPKVNDELKRFYYQEEEGEGLLEAGKVAASELPTVKHNKMNNKKSKVKPIESSKEPVRAESKKKAVSAHSESGDDSDEGQGFQWHEESSSSDSELRASDFEEEDENAQDLWSNESGEVVRNEQSSHLIAMMNYDWMHLNAPDILILFNSLKPQTSIIKSVTVYPSEFGKEQMKIEQEHGPRTIWKDENENDDSKPKKKKKDVVSEINEWIVEKENENDLDPIKLRRYEKDRLKYYYAIIECDNKKTAEYIYDNFDGMEFELTSMKLDLRFVPKTTIVPQEPKERCTDVPMDHKVSKFLNRALNHTKVALTWEEPNYNRFGLIDGKNMSQKDLDRLQWDKFLGDDEEISDEDDEEELVIRDEEFPKKGKGAGDSTGKSWRQDFDKKKRREINDMEMEITFDPVFSDLGNKILDKQKNKDETLWEKYQRKRKEKKDLKKAVKQGQLKDDDYFIEPEEKKKPKSEKPKSRKDEKKYLQELELLVDEDPRKKNFEVNASEDRFKAIYEDSRFAIDPTHPQFKLEGVGKIFKEQVNRRKNKTRQDDS